MAYFPNGTTAEMYREQFCDHCANDSEGTCPIWIAHELHNYDDVNDPERWLNLFIPQDGVHAGKCNMFCRKDTVKLRPADEYHEDMGDVLWWRVPVQEPPYVGSPRDAGRTVEVAVQYYGLPTVDGELPILEKRMQLSVGGWIEGYYTHFMELPDVSRVAVVRLQQPVAGARGDGEGR